MPEESPGRPKSGPFYLTVQHFDLGVDDPEETRAHAFYSTDSRSVALSLYEVLFGREYCLDVDYVPDPDDPGPFCEIVVADRVSPADRVRFKEDISDLKELNRWDKSPHGTRFVGGHEIGRWEWLTLRLYREAKRLEPRVRRELGLTASSTKSKAAEANTSAARTKALRKPSLDAKASVSTEQWLGRLDSIEKELARLIPDSDLHVVFSLDLCEEGKPRADEPMLELLMPEKLGIEFFHEMPVATYKDAQLGTIWFDITRGSLPFVWRWDCPHNGGTEEVVPEHVKAALDAGTLRAWYAWYYRDKDNREVPVHLTSMRWKDLDLAACDAFEHAPTAVVQELRDLHHLGYWSHVLLHLAVNRPDSLISAQVWGPDLRTNHKGTESMYAIGTDVVIQLRPDLRTATALAFDLMRRIAGGRREESARETDPYAAFYARMFPYIAGLLNNDIDENGGWESPTFLSRKEIAESGRIPREIADRQASLYDTTFILWLRDTTLQFRDNTRRIRQFLLDRVSELESAAREARGVVERVLSGLDPSERGCRARYESYAWSLGYASMILSSVIRFSQFDMVERQDDGPERDTARMDIHLTVEAVKSRFDKAILSVIQEGEGAIAKAQATEYALKDTAPGVPVQFTAAAPQVAGPDSKPIPRSGDAEMICEVANALKKMESIDRDKDPLGAEQAAIAALKLAKKYLARIVELRDEFGCPPGADKCIQWLDLMVDTPEHLEKTGQKAGPDLYSVEGWQLRHEKPFSEQMRGWAKEIEGKAAKSDRKVAASPQDEEARDDKVLRVRAALHASKGSVTKAAEQLGVSRPTLYEWMAELGIDPSEYR